jgi:hypothetical protein
VVALAVALVVALVVTLVVALVVAVAREVRPVAVGNKKPGNDPG